MIATFMPKPFTERTGSGMHLHLSLDPWRRAGLSRSRQRRAGLGCRQPHIRSSPAFWITHARCRPSSLQRSIRTSESEPTLPRRVQPGHPRTPTYGGNDRTHYIRVPDEQRVELRGADGSANPYLAIAAALGAGLEGSSAVPSPGEVAPCAPIGRHFR